MSEPTETSSPTSAEAPMAVDDMFAKTDLKFFDAEDGHAGGVIGKMLSLFFFYTVIVMSLVAYWTIKVSS